MKKQYLLSLTAIYILYAIAVITVNNVIGDILSPVLTFIALYFVYDGFVKKETLRIYKVSGLLFALSLFAWFLLDLIWGISTLIMHLNPENNLFIIYGYSLTNLLLFLSLVISGYIIVSSLNKIQAILDTLIIALGIAVILWVFVFQQDVDKAKIIQSDIIFMITITLDIMILAWTTVWFFSIRTRKPPRFVGISAIGGVLFVVSDLIYYYQYFYTSYEPNSLLDGGYMLSFTLMAISGYVKSKEKYVSNEDSKRKQIFYQFSKEAIILSVPVLIFLFHREQTKYLFLMTISILVYYVMSNYAQKMAMQDKLLQSERDHVSELEKKVEERTREIVRIMNTDIVTGLYSRRYFDEYLTRACLERKENEYLSILYIDINKLKSIKSLYGNYTAEILLKEVGKKLNKLISIFGEGALLASYGEDHFVVALKDELQNQQALSLSKGIINKCSGKYHIENNEMVITLNVGIACYPYDTKEQEDLIRNADSAMMYARKIGSNKYHLFNDNIGRYVHNRNNLEIELKKVNFDQDFSLHYQPQVACTDGEIIGTEALLRWYTKNGAYIPPSEFIPIAEESGQIITLGYWIIENAAKQMVTWRNHSSKEIRMAINVSVKQLCEKDFVPKVKEIFDRYHLSPDLFELEITENIQLEGNTDVLDNLMALREIGSTIALDDFGTGYSSLYSLKNFPMDKIKIAKELVDNVENDSYSSSIIRAVIDMAKRNGIKVIAEGVETKEQWKCLKDLNCDEIQGYLFAKPMPGDKLQNSWLSDMTA